MRPSGHQVLPALALESSSLQPGGSDLCQGQRQSFQRGRGRSEEMGKTWPLGLGEAPSGLASPKLSSHTPSSPMSLSLPARVFFSFSGLSFWAPSDCLALPLCLPCLWLLPLCLCLCLSSSLSRVYVSVGLPVGSSQPLSAPALLSSPSFGDWLSYKPFRQELGWWNSDGCLIASQKS